ncbi:MAG: protein kinase [Acidobacteriia bacterium]|nr:protein kinase [Terriglobia bacterium]
MTSERRNQVDSLYRAAVTLNSPQRRAFLDQACHGEAELRREVETLLDEESDAPSEPLVAGLSTQTQATPGAKFGPYQLEVLLGEGGMGQVFRARDTRLGRMVAIKVIRKECAGDGDFRQRFQREARASAALNHPHICTLYDVGEHDGSPYMVMEYVEGQTLASRLREGPLPVERLLRCATEMALALIAAHERGIMHRDLKPANLMLTPAGIKVLDFGLAKFAGLADADGSMDATVASRILGTPSYMSPEQAQGEKIDHRSDLFSFGCVLYEAATGVRPFRGSSVLDVLREVVTAHPAPASVLRPELPSQWDEILHRSLAKDRSLRFQSAADLFQALEGLKGSPKAAAPRAEERQPDAVFGRDKELSKLDELLRSSVDGVGRLVMVLGEPGIGKTALTSSFAYTALRRNADLLLARGACVEQHGAGEAYLPFLDAVSSLLQGPGGERVRGLLRRFAPTWCLQFPAMFSGNAIEQLKREATGATKDRMLRELGDAMGALTAETPVLLFLEDVHWIDPASVDMMRHLAERARGQRLMFLATARLEDVERGNPTLKKCYTEMHARGVCEEIALGALVVRDIAAYLDAHYSPNEFPAELAGVIHKKSEGHSLFATGAIQLLAEHGEIVRDNGAWKLRQPLAQIELNAPVNVRSMIEKKVGLLNDQQRQTLQYASIEGEEFTSTTLAGLLEADELELEERLDTLGKLHRLIRVEREEELPDGSLATVYRFTHALYQYFLYDQLLSKRRVLLHRRAGEIMERSYAGKQSRVAAALATHFERGRDFSKAIQYLIQAGDNALSRYANAEAVNYYGRGLELVDKLPEAGKAAQQIVLLRKRAVSRLALGQLKESFSDYAALRGVCQTAGNLDEECRALIGLTTVAHNLRELADIEHYGQAAMALAERIGNQPLAAEAVNNWAVYMAVLGRLSEAQSYFERSIPLARSIGHKAALPAGLMYRGILHFWKSKFEAAEQVQMEACQVAAEVRDGFYLPLALLYLGLTRANRGRISEAMASMQEALDLARLNNNGVALSRVPNGIGWVWREIGDLSKAIEFNQGCVETSRRTRAAEAESNGLINLVYDYLQAGEPAKAAEALEGVQPLYEREKWNRWRFYGIRHRAAESEYWLSLGKLDRAEEHARTLLENAVNNGVPKYISIADRLLGEIAAAAGDHNTAEEALTRSLDPFTKHPMPLIEWRNHVALGRLLAARNRPAAARESFARAEKLVQDLAVGIIDPALRDLFLRTNAVREVLAGAAGQ